MCVEIDLCVEIERERERERERALARAEYFEGKLEASRIHTGQQQVLPLVPYLSVH